MFSLHLLQTEGDSLCVRFVRLELTLLYLAVYIIKASKQGLRDVGGPKKCGGIQKCWHSLKLKHQKFHSNILSLFLQFVKISNKGSL